MLYPVICQRFVSVFGFNSYNGRLVPFFFSFYPHCLTILFIIFAFESPMTESRDRKEKKLPVCARAVLPFPVQMKECRRMAKGYIIRWNGKTFVR